MFVLPLEYRMVAAAAFVIAALGGGFYVGKYATAAIYRDEIATSKKALELAQLHEKEAIDKLERATDYYSKLSGQLDTAITRSMAGHAATLAAVRDHDVKTTHCQREKK